MPAVEVARHLHRFFPQLEGRKLHVEGATAADCVRAMDALAPGFSDYVLDERGRLRQHVNVFIDQDMVVDRATLADPVPEHATLFVFQALSGG